MKTGNVKCFGRKRTRNFTWEFKSSNRFWCVEHELNSTFIITVVRNRHSTFLFDCTWKRMIPVMGKLLKVFPEFIDIVERAYYEAMGSLITSSLRVEINILLYWWIQHLYTLNTDTKNTEKFVNNLFLNRNMKLRFFMNYKIT